MMTAAVVDLAAWVRLWAREYPQPHDEQLGPLWGKPALDAEDRKLLARWKFESDRRRLQRTLNLLAGNDPSWADELTRRALACNDDLGAWLIAQRILGVGPALASAMLMAHDRKRFTVIDSRAFQSIRVLVQSGSLKGDGVDPGRLQGAVASGRTWLVYLNACRALGAATACSLRDVDRALYAAKGREALPQSR